jgi:hypothetical protein
MPADTDQPTLAVTQSDSEFLYDLAGRLFRHATPAMGFDQCDTDRLYRMARTTHEPRPAGDLRGLLTRITVAHNRLHRSEITPQEFDEYALGLLATHSPAPMAGDDVEAEAISLIVDLCGVGASQSATNVRVVEDHLRQFARQIAAHPSTQED